MHTPDLRVQRFRLGLVLVLEGTSELGSRRRARCSEGLGGAIARRLG
jgi:hypothetical protein